MAAFDFKKEQKDLYQPGPQPCVIHVPEMLFLMVDGQGDPNTAKAYEQALEVLYGLSYAIKMSKMSAAPPQGYFEYVVPPLEGQWWTPQGGYDGKKPGEKDRLQWTSMIRQPDFVTPDVLEAAKAALHKKKPGLDTDLARLARWTEGLSAQILHVGPYDDEPETIARMDEYMAQQGFCLDFSGERKHHEIYLGDPRKTAPEKLKTILRHPVRKA